MCYKHLQWIQDNVGGKVIIFFGRVGKDYSMHPKMIAYATESFEITLSNTE